MDVIKDVYFANISGTVDDNHYLDLYVPTDCEQSLGQGNSNTTSCLGNGADLLNRLTGVTSERDVNEGSRSALNNTDYSDTKLSLNRSTWEDNIQGDSYNTAGDLYTKSDIRDSTELYDGYHNSDRKAPKPPLVIFVHGGGWRRGGREAWTHFLYYDVNFLLVILSLFVGTYKNVGRALAKNGIACAVISYPLTEAGLGCLLMELCISYIQSCLAVTIVTLPVLGLLCVESGIYWSHSVRVWTQLNNVQLLSTIVLMIMLTTNSITIIIFTIKRDKYKLRPYHIRMLWLTLAVGAICITNANENKLLQSVILTLLINQCVIFNLRLARSGGCYEAQTEVLARAVKWAKTTGHETGLFDTSRVYLMGHSAGGHLVSLTALDDDILAKVGCSSKDITGVVSLSGVYDLLCLRGPFLRPLYLFPTFGHSHSTWVRASPSHVIRTKTTKDEKSRPKFLLIVAENDLFLKQQSIQFSKSLQEAEVDCRHIEVIGTNHFTIVTSLVKRFTGNDKSVLHHIMHFIHN